MATRQNQPRRTLLPRRGGGHVPGRLPHQQLSELPGGTTTCEADSHSVPLLAELMDRPE